MKKKQLIKVNQVNPAVIALGQKIQNNRMFSAAARFNMVVSLMVLHDKFDFDNESLEQFIDECKYQLDAYNAGYVEEIKDFENVLWDECGIKVEL